MGPPGLTQGLASQLPDGYRSGEAGRLGDDTGPGEESMPGTAADSLQGRSNRAATPPAQVAEDVARRGPASSGSCWQEGGVG